MKEKRVMLTKKTANELLHLFLDIGEKLMGSGAEVSRIEETLQRLGNAYGVERMNVFVITSSIVVTMELPDGDKVTQTRRLSGPGTNFTKMEKINELSRRVCEKPMSPEELRYELEHLGGEMNLPLLYIGSAVAAGSHAVFFGGTFADGIMGALFGLFICFLQIKLPRICQNNMVFNLMASLLSGIAICAVTKFIPFVHTDKVMIGDIMLLIPGIAMTNAVRDILVGDTISGIMRLIESLLWAACLALGFMISIVLIGG